MTYTRNWDNELGSGVVYIRDSARVIHFGSPVGEQYVKATSDDEVKQRWWHRAKVSK